MKSRRSYFIIIVISILVVATNVSLIYVDEKLESLHRELSENKVNVLAFGKEIHSNITEAEKIFENGWHKNDVQSENKLKEKLHFHLGYLPRPSSLVLFPLQTKSHNKIVENLVEGSIYKSKAENALLHYRDFLHWGINALQNRVSDVPSVQGNIDWPESKNLAVQLMESFVVLAYNDFHRQQGMINLRLKKISKVMVATIVISLLFFGVLAFIFLFKLLDPYLANKGRLETLGNQIFLAANVAFWEFDMQKNVYRGGREFARFLGVEKESVELTIEQILERMDPHERSLFVERVQGFMAAKVPKAFYEVSFRDYRGRKRFMSVLAEYLYSPEGKLLKRHGFIQDITSMKKIEKELQLSQGKLEEVLYQLEIGVAEVSPVWNENAMVDIQFNNVNEAFCRIFQQPASEIKGRNYSEVFQFFGNSWIRLMSRYLKGDITTNTTELYNKSLNKWLKIKVYRESEFRIIAFVEDITEEQNIRQSLRKSRERMVFSEKMARFGYCEIDLTKNVLSGNQVAFEIHGLSNSNKLSAEKFMKVLVPDDKRIIKDFAGALKARQQVEGTYRVLVKNEVRYIHCKLESFNTNGYRYAFGFVHDVTETKQGELELIKAKEKAEESDQLKNAFLANMSHEIRTPLSAILGFSSILAKNEVEDDDQRKECQQLIEKNSNALMILINDVIEMAKIESGEIVIRPTPFNVNQFINDAYNMFSAELIKKGRTSLRLFKQTANEGEFLIFADYDRINQIINNLISNAIKFTPKGFIEFGYQFEGNEIIFFVRDSGIGIEEDKTEVIFKMFRQANLKIAGEFGGTGLGLAICEKLVDLMDGKIWVDSVKGVGSTFFFSLPLVHEYKSPQKPSVVEEALERSIPDFSGKVILVADDEEFIHVLFRNYLSETGVQVLSTYNGLKTVETLHKNPHIDLVLLDMRMPEMNGEDAVIEIRKQNKKIPVIAQTAYAFEGDKDRFLADGCTDYMSKPIKEDELLRILSKYLI